MNVALTVVNSADPGQSSGLKLDPRTYARGLSCVHCGLCLPACPTYTQTWNEADSPRGRIQLMLGLSDGVIQASESVQQHLDQCLDCRACETICPSGVVYHELIEEARPKLDQIRRLSMQSALMRWMFFNILTKPFRLSLAMLPARLIKKLHLLNLLPDPFRKMASMTPSSGPLFPQSLSRLTPSSAPDRPKHRVAFFPTCIGSVMYDQVNRQSIELLSACGAEVVVAPMQLCCGAIHHHNGAPHAAEELARKNIDAILDADGQMPDLITTTVAGCGAMLRDYPYLMRDDPRYHQRAEAFSSRVRDITEVLEEMGLPEMKFPVNETVTYHDACHLAHAQRVTAAPRTLLMKIPGLKLIALPESDICCGAAGTYNLTQPKMAADLGMRKLRNIAATGCNTVVAGNIGCAMHIEATAQQSNRELRVTHPVQLIHRAVFGSDQR